MPTTSQSYPPYAMLQEIVKTSAGKKLHVVPQEEPISSDALAFCALITRIVMRCLSEKDERVMKVLFLRSVSEE